MRHLVYVMLYRAALSCVMRVLLRYLMLQCVVFEGDANLMPKSCLWGFSE